MGMRITTKLGWGLDDLVENDPRINLDALHALYDETDMEQYIEWLDGRLAENQNRDQQDLNLEVSLATERHHLARMIQEDRTLDNLRKNPDLRDSLPFLSSRVPSFYKAITWNDEGGLANVFHITPLWLTSKWCRYNDAIDGAHFALRSNIDEGYDLPIAEFLEENPYPYNGLYMDARRGRSLSAIQNSVVRRVLILQNVKYFEKYPEALEEEVEDLGVRVRDVLEFFVPDVPEEVKLLLEFGQIFTDETAWQSLRPMLYTYLS